MAHKFQDFPTEAIVEVDWIDSYGSGYWQQKKDTLADDKDTAYCRTAGYLLKKDREWVHIAGSRTKSDSTNERISIPRFAILSLRVIQPPRKVPKR